MKIGMLFYSYKIYTRMYIYEDNLQGLLGLKTNKRKKYKKKKFLNQLEDA